MTETAARDCVKRRGLNFQPDVDSRQLRAHRRSVERRSFRRSIFDLQRADLLQLEAVVEETANAVNSQLTLGESHQLSRREKLRRWKEEKAFKKKLEAEKRAAKPVFKVCHLEYKLPVYNPPSIPVVSTRNRRVPASSTATSALFEKRVTRSATARANAAPRAALVIEGRRARPVREAAVAATASARTIMTRQTKARDDQTPAAVREHIESQVDDIEDVAVPASEECPVELVDDVAAPEVELLKSRISFAPENFEFKAPVLMPLSSQHSLSTAFPKPLCDAPVVHETDGNSHSANEVEDAAITVEKVTRVSVSATVEVPLDVSYFRNLQHSYGTQLRKLCDEWSSVLDTEASLSDGVVGRIRSVVGKANLLMNERFDQFTNLMDDCEHVRGDKITTCSDLQGFWEMFFPQVTECLEKFQKLENIRSNGFVDEETPVKLLPRLPRGPNTIEAKCNKTNHVEHKRAARQRLANFKKIMAERKKASDSLTEVQEASAALPTASLNLNSISAAPLVTSPTSFSKAERQKTPKKISLCQSVLQRNFLMDDAEIRSSPRRSLRMLQVLSPLVNERQITNKSNRTDMKNVSNKNTQNKTPPFSPKLNRNSDLIRFSDAFFTPDAKENIGQNPLAEYLALVDAEQYPDSSFDQ